MIIIVSPRNKAPLQYDKELVEKALGHGHIFEKVDLNGESHQRN